MRKTDWESVIKHIPVGRENAVTRQKLEALTGNNDRTNRQAILEARSRGIKIVSSSSGKGYYIADNNDDWRMFLEEHRRRAMSELTIYNEGMKLLPGNYIAAQIVPVRAHVRHLKSELPCDGQIELEV